MQKRTQGPDKCRAHVEKTKAVNDVHHFVSYGTVILGLPDNFEVSAWTVKVLPQGNNPKGIHKSTLKWVRKKSKKACCSCPDLSLVKFQQWNLKRRLRMN